MSDISQELLNMLARREVATAGPGAYMHTFTPPGWTLDDAAGVIMQAPHS